ncbi:MAG: hypothetical protein Q8942_05540 [Bacillota bacterium]|nr:hypothetical protein [Bacillota bacterium]
MGDGVNVTGADTAKKSKVYLEVENKLPEADSKDKKKIAEAILKRGNSLEMLEGTGGRPSDISNRVTVEQVRAELKKSAIGRETLDYIDKHGVKILLSYEPQQQVVNGKVYKIMGENNSLTKLIKCFVTNTITPERSSATIVHEVTHRMFRDKGIPYTKQEEFLCRLRQELHLSRGKPVPLSILRKHYKLVKNAPQYQNLPDKIPNRKGIK